MFSFHITELNSERNFLHKFRASYRKFTENALLLVRTVDVSRCRDCLLCPSLILFLDVQLRPWFLHVLFLPRSVTWCLVNFVIFCALLPRDIQFVPQKLSRSLRKFQVSVVIVVVVVSERNFVLYDLFYVVIDEIEFLQDDRK